MAAFFVRRPTVAIVIAIMTVLVGLLAARSLPVAQFPPIIPPQILVSTNYPGADAVTVEQAIATPLEQQMNGVEDMLYIQSTNANDGTMGLTVTFDIDTDPDIAQIGVQNRAAQASSNLPPDVAQYGLSYRKATGTPTMLIGLYSPERRYDALFLANYASINIIDALYRVKGVGDVRLFGSSDYAMRVWVKPDVLARTSLTVADVARAVRAQNNVNPAGRLGAEPGPPGVEKTYTVRAQGRLVTAEEFGRIVVRSDPGGRVIRLGDVARIELGALNYQQRARVNGQPGALVAVFQSPGSNALDVARGIRAALEDLEAGFPAGLAYAVTLDTSLPVAAGLSEMLETIVIAMLLVTLVVFLFLQSWRATLIPMVAVPVSLVGTFAVFPLFGFGINTLSLFGLVLAIGLVVDDAIIVVEAVQHHVDEGMPAREATLLAMREVSGPVVAVALILSAVLIPMAFVGGIQGRLNTQFAVTIAISVVISGFNALTLSPALAATLLRPRRPSSGPLARSFALFNRLFDRGARGYVRASHRLIRKAALGVVLLLLFSAAAAVMGSRLPTSFLPEEDQGYLLVNITLPPAASLERTDVAARKVEAVLRQTEGVKSYNSVIGLSMLTRVTATYSGFFFVQLEPWGARADGLDAGAIRDRLDRALATAVPEATAMAYAPASIPGLGNAGGFSMWIQDRSGGSVELLDQKVKEFVAEARKRPEIGAVNSPFSAGIPQVYAEVDRDKAMAQGVAIEDVYATLQANLGGVYVNQFNRFGRQWRVFVGAEGDYRLSEEDIGEYQVRNDQGRMVPLSTVVTTRRMSGPEYTNRFNLYRAAQVLGSAAPGYSSGEAMAALEEVAASTLPREMGIDWADLSYQERRASGAASAVFGLSLVFVFLILAALYESWSLPLSVLLSVPIAVFGAFAGLMLRGYHLDVFGQIGLVMLIGLAAKNAILIVELAVDELGRGRDLVGAALEGARRRLRPILMTSCAFILGCVPLYVASGSGAAGRRVLGTVVIAGMLAVTAIAVFLIPLLFVLVERIAGRRGTPHAPPTALASPPGGHGHGHGHGPTGGPTW